jgi:hypothetical protein
MPEAGADVLARLRGGDRLLLDGATGSELHRRGVNVSKGASVQAGLGPWSATAMEDAPDVVRAVHEDYSQVQLGRRQPGLARPRTEPRTQRPLTGRPTDRAPRL